MRESNVYVVVGYGCEDVGALGGIADAAQGESDSGKIGLSNSPAQQQGCAPLFSAGVSLLKGEFAFDRFGALSFPTASAASAWLDSAPGQHFYSRMRNVAIVATFPTPLTSD